MAINLYEEAPELGKKMNPTLQNNFRTLVDVAKVTRTSMADTTGMSFPKINMGPAKGDFYRLRTRQRKPKTPIKLIGVPGTVTQTGQFTSTTRKLNFHPPGIIPFEEEFEIPYEESDEKTETVVREVQGKDTVEVAKESHKKTETVVDEEQGEDTVKAAKESHEKQDEE